MSAAIARLEKRFNSDDAKLLQRYVAAVLVYNGLEEGKRESSQQDTCAIREIWASFLIADALSLRCDILHVQQLQDRWLTPQQRVISESSSEDDVPQRREPKRKPPSPRKTPNPKKRASTSDYARFPPEDPNLASFQEYLTSLDGGKLTYKY